MRNINRFLILLVVGATTWVPEIVRAEPVLDLALVVDASPSIDESEFGLQTEAYASAFERREVQDLIGRAGTMGGIRVTMLLFTRNSRVAVDWTTLIGASDADAFAEAIRGVSRNGLGDGTSIARGLQLANQQFSLLSDPAGRRIVDVSGDGDDNILGAQAVRDARDEALMQYGVDQINGLVIGGTSLQEYYQDNVIGGTDAFVRRVDNFDLFESAIFEKLDIELSSAIPEPSSIVLVGLGAVLVPILRRRRQRPVA